MSLLLSILTVVGQLFVVFVVVSLIFKFKNPVLKLIQENSVFAAFLVATMATAGSLYYSEIANLPVCELCWFQRIFMYSQVVILFLAMIKKDSRVLVYNFWLSAFGAPIALYHYFLQIGAAPAVSCSVVGYSVDCSETFFLRFGYITIPMMAFTAFLMIISIYAASKKSI